MRVNGGVQPRSVQRQHSQDSKRECLQTRTPDIRWMRTEPTKTMLNISVAMGGSARMRRERKKKHSSTFRARQKGIARRHHFTINHHPPRHVRNRHHRLPAPRRGSPFIRLPPAPSAGGGADPIVNRDPPPGAAAEAGAPKPTAGGAAAFGPAPNANGALPVVPDGRVVLPVAGEAG